MAKIENLTPANFTDTVAHGTVLLDFWATWCNPCKMLGKVLEQVAPLAPADLLIAKANIEECPELAAQYEVTTVPQMILLKDGAVVKRFPGGTVLTKPAILKEIEAVQ